MTTSWTPQTDSGEPAANALVPADITAQIDAEVADKVAEEVAASAAPGGDLNDAIAAGVLAIGADNTHGARGDAITAIGADNTHGARGDAITAITTQQTTSVNAVNSAGTTQVTTVNAAGATQVTNIATAGSAVTLYYATWSALSARSTTGLVAGQHAEVLLSDSGTHTDPVVGGTVANSGVYAYSTSPAGWQRLGNISTAETVAALSRLPSMVTSYYPCDEGSGSSIRDIVGNLPATLTNGSGTVAWTTDGWLQLTSGYFKLPSQTLQTVIVIFRAPEGYTNYIYSTPSGAAIGNGFQSASSAATIRSMAGWGIKDVPRRTNSTVANDWLVGGWEMTSLAQASSSTGIATIGAANSSGSGAVSSVEIAGIVVCSGSPSDAELRRILNYAAENSRRRGIYLTPWHCPQKAHLAVVSGESTGEGTYLLSSLSAGQRAAMNEAVLIQARNSTSAANTGSIMKRLSLAATYANNNAPSTNTKSGLETGLLNARIARTNDGRPLHILKVAQGSTFLIPSGTYTNASGGSTVVGASVSRNTAELETGGLYYLLKSRNMLRFERIARNQGIGYTSVTTFEAEGLNDAYLGSTAISSSGLYQGWLQDQRDKDILILGMLNHKQVYLKPHNPSGGLGGGDADYPNNSTGTSRLTALGYIRQALVDFQAANSSDVSLLDGDNYALNTPTDYTHPNATGYDNMGQAYEALLSYTVSVTPRA